MAEFEPWSSPDDAAASSILALETAICLFAFGECVDALRPPPPDATLESALLLHRFGSIIAFVGVVPIADYSGPKAERRSNDVAWLAPRVRRHAELVAWIAQSSSIFPAPFGTLYASLDNLTAFMRAHEATIAAFLRAVADKEEWELRADVSFDDPDVLDRLACDAWPDWRKLPKGSRYMRLCRDRGALLDFGRATAAAFVRDFVAELRPLTSDTRVMGLPRAPGSGGPEPVARFALLVARTGVAAIKGRVREIALKSSGRNVAIAMSGPWPPFSFRPDLK